MALGALYGLMGGLGQGLSEGNQELGGAIDRYRKFQDAKRERQALGLIQRSALGGLTGGQPAPGGIDQQQPDYGPGAVQQGPLGPSGPAPGIPSGTAMAPMQIPSRDPEVVKGSWFGSQPGWKDPMSGPQTASGTPLSVPGIALPTRAGLGKQFDVTAPSGQTYRLPQTDVGPAKWTGRGVDINSAAAQQMGYTPQNFPTDKNFKVHPVDQAMGSPPQAAQASSAIAKSAMQGMPQTAFGMVQPAQVAQMIERAAGPGVPDDVKGLALMKLFPMFSEQGQEAYKRALEQHKFGVQSGEKAEEFRQREADRVADRDLRGRGLDIQAGHLTEQQRHDRAIEAGGGGSGVLHESHEYEIAKADGSVERVMAREGSKAAGLVDSVTGKPVPIPEGAKVRKISGGELGGVGRENVQTQRQLISGREVLSDLRNVAELPISTTTGIFGGRKQGPGLLSALKEDLAQNVTGEDAQLYNAALSGFERELAIIVSPVYSGKWAAESFAPLQMREGMTNLVKLYNLARIRQTADNALEGVLASPRIGAKQQMLAEEVRAGLAEAIPWTPHDVLAYRGKGEEESFGDFVKSHNVGGAQAREVSREEYDKLPAGAAYKVPGDPAVRYKQ